MNPSTNASAESDHVDMDEVRREKFRQRNVHGHSSDSSVARLLCGQSATETEAVVEVAETGPLTLRFIINAIFLYSSMTEFTVILFQSESFGSWGIKYTG